MDSVLLRCIIVRVFVFSRAYINVCPRAGMHCIEYSLVFNATECAESIAAQMKTREVMSLRCTGNILRSSVMQYILLNSVHTGRTQILILL